MANVLCYTAGKITAFFKEDSDEVKDADNEFKSRQLSLTPNDSEEEIFGDDSKETEQAILPYLSSALFGTIIEDAAMQLQIVVETSTAIKIIKTKSDWEQLRRIKFGVKQTHHVDELERIDPNKLNCNEYKINKLDADRIYINETVLKTYENLSLNRTYKALEASVNSLIAKEAYRKALAQEELKNRGIRRDLTKQLRQQRNHIKTLLYDTDVKIDRLIARIEDAIFIDETRSRYLTNWQQARTEQHVETIQEKESVHSTAVDYYKDRTDQEYRVHFEIVMLMNIAIQESLENVETIMTKYDVDMEEIDLKIQIKKNDCKNIQDKRRGLQKTFEERAAEMKNWIEFKDERERVRLYRLKMNNAAIAVQAWWRGLLVRREMGPYKPVKRRPPPAPAKKKK